MADHKSFIKARRIKQVIGNVLFLFALIGGWCYHLFGYFIPLCMIAGLAIGVFRGRTWCNWVCPKNALRFDTGYRDEGLTR